MKPKVFPYTMSHFLQGLRNNYSPFNQGLAGPAFGGNGQLDAPPPYEEPLYQNAVEGGNPLPDVPPGRPQRDPEDGDAAHLEQVAFKVC